MYKTKYMTLSLSVDNGPDSSWGPDRLEDPMSCYQELLLSYGRRADESGLTSLPAGASPLLWRWRW